LRGMRIRGSYGLREKARNYDVRKEGYRRKTCIRTLGSRKGNRQVFWGMKPYDRQRKSAHWRALRHIPGQALSKPTDDRWGGRSSKKKGHPECWDGRILVNWGRKYRLAFNRIGAIRARRGPWHWI